MEIVKDKGLEKGDRKKKGGCTEAEPREPVVGLIVYHGQVAARRAASILNQREWIREPDWKKKKKKDSFLVLKRLSQLLLLKRAQFTK